MSDKLLTRQNLFYLYVIFLLSGTRFGLIRYSIEYVLGSERGYEYLEFIYNLISLGVLAGLILTIALVKIFKNNRFRLSLKLFLYLLSIGMFFGATSESQYLDDDSLAVLIVLSWATYVALFAGVLGQFYANNRDRSDQQLFSLLFLIALINTFSFNVVNALLGSGEKLEEYMLIPMSVVWVIVLCIFPKALQSKPSETSSGRLTIFWPLILGLLLIKLLTNVSYSADGFQEYFVSPATEYTLIVVGILIIQLWIWLARTERSLFLTRIKRVINPIVFLTVVTALLAVFVAEALFENELNILVGFTLFSLTEVGYILVFTIAAFVLIRNNQSVSHLVVVTALLIAVNNFNFFGPLNYVANFLGSNFSDFFIPISVVITLVLLTRLSAFNKQFVNWIESGAQVNAYARRKKHYSENRDSQPAVSVRSWFKRIRLVMPLFARLSIASFYFISISIPRGLSPAIHNSACAPDQLSLIVLCVEIIACLFLLLGKFSRFFALVIILAAASQYAFIDGLYSTYYGEFAKHADELTTMVILSLLVLIFGSGYLSMDRLEPAERFGSYKQFVAVIVTAIISSYIYTQIQDETARVKYDQSSSLSYGNSQLTMRSHAVIVATEMLLLDTLNQAIVAYYDQGFRITDQVTELGFLNDFINQYYPNADYSVIEDDFWGEKYEFIWLSDGSYGLRSSGPDRVMDTDDDLRLICKDECEMHADYKGGNALSWLRHGRLFELSADRLSFRVFKESHRYFDEIPQLNDSDNLLCPN